MKQYVVDAFTDSLFKGNQAAVCVMDQWIPDELMLNIAKENNFSETAFTVKENDGYRLRWFTPGGEIDFCGHATLGTSFVLFNFYEKDAEEIIFYAQVGKLTIKREQDLFVMDFPAYQCNPVPVTEAMAEAIGVMPEAAYIDRDLLLILKEEEQVRNLRPDMKKIEALDGVLVAVSAPGKEYDCVSRMFAPKLSVPEDPVTGSTHCMVTPYWCQRLGKERLTCYQASERTGVLYTSFEKDRVKVAGKAVLYSVADILPDVKA